MSLALSTGTKHETTCGLSLSDLGLDISWTHTKKRKKKKKKRSNDNE